MNDILKYITDNKIMLSPLAGISDLSFRLMCRKFGCKFAFTEMVDAKAVLYAKSANFRLLDMTPEDLPLGVQLAEYDEEIMLKAALKCEEMGKFSLLNINAACPMRKVISSKKGVYLMKEPEQIAKMIRLLVKNVKMPVTLKIRSGFDVKTKNCEEIAKIAQDEGAKAIFIHPRHGKQKYSGKIDKNDLNKVIKAVKIPVIVSGDLFTAHDAVNMLNESGCAAVALARGSFGKPWIFKQIYQLLNGEKEIYNPTIEERKVFLKEHFHLLSQNVPAKIAVPIMYKHILWYLKNAKDLHSIMKEHYKDIKTKEGFDAFLERL